MGGPRRASRSSSSLLPLLVFTAACGDDGVPDPPFGTPIDSVGGTDGVATDGVSEPDGVDDTGGAVPAAVEDHCLFEPMEGLYGYQYQCQGSVFLDVVIEGNFGGSPATDSLVLSFGQGVDGDSYQDPLVMACCPWYRTGPDDLNCDQHHERACLIDLVEQGCKSMVSKLEDYAHDTFPGPGNVIKRNAVLDIADYVRNHQGHCTAAFREDTGIANTPPACDQDGNGEPYVAMLEQGIWAFDPDGPVDRVEIAVAAAEWLGIHPIDDAQQQTTTCESADDNDGVLFLEIDPPSGAKILHLDSGSVALAGPEAQGYGELDSSSTLALHAGASGSASLENLALHSAGGAAVAASGVSIPIDDFHVRLWDRAPAIVDAEGQSLTIAAGSARFAISVTALGEHRVRTAVNATLIAITRDVQGWRTSAFSIDDLRRGEQWSLVIAPARWQ